MKPCSPQEATVSSTKCGTNVPLITLRLQSAQLQSDYVISHLFIVKAQMSQLIVPINTIIAKISPYCE